MIMTLSATVMTNSIKMKLN